MNGPAHPITQGVDGRGHVWTGDPLAPGSFVFATFPTPQHAYAALKAAESLTSSFFMNKQGA